MTTTAKHIKNSIETHFCEYKMSSSSQRSRSRHRRTNLDSHWLRDIEQQKCYYESSTHITYLFCWWYWFVERMLCWTYKFIFSFFSVRFYTSALCHAHNKIFFLFVHLFDDVCFTESHEHAHTHTHIHMAEMGCLAIRFMIIWKKFISTRFRYEFTSILIQTYRIFNQIANDVRANEITTTNE